MFARKPKTNESGLDVAIDQILKKLADYEPDSKEYSKAANQLVKLYALKEKPQRVSPDTMAIIAGNILVTTVIVGYEQKAVIASKAKDFWMKLR